MLEAHSIRTSTLFQNKNILHGFSTRKGGVSQGPFSSLNVAYNTDDDPTAVTENLHRITKHFNILPSQLYQTSQVHGANIYQVHESDSIEEIRHKEADALISRSLHVAVAIRVADCVPILLYDESTRHVAAVHAGWRGLVARIIEASIKALNPNHTSGIFAAIGPCIGACCFEVDKTVGQSIANASHASVLIQRNDRWFVNLRIAARNQLIQQGVSTHHIDDVEACTYCGAEWFFSFRRDGSKSGRHLAIIAPG